MTPVPPAAAERTGRHVELVPPSIDLIAAVLEHHDVKYGTDPEGDLYGFWDDDQIDFSLAGDAPFLHIRLLTAAPFPADDTPALYRFCNDWNLHHHFPKAYVHPESEEGVTVCGETSVDLRSGVTSDQLEHLVLTGIDACCRLAAAVGELRAGRVATA